VLADSGASTGNVTAESLAPHVTARTRALVVTHLFGEPCDMGPVRQLARRHGLAVIEDCSHAHGARFADGSGVGTVGDVAIYSVGGVKAVSGGLGGLLLTDDEDMFDIACLLSAFKQRSRSSIRRPGVRALADTGLGGNLRMSPVAAVLALSHLVVATKQANAAALERALTVPGELTPVPTDPRGDRGARYGVHLSLDSATSGVGRDALVVALTRAGLQVTAPRTRLLHRSSLFRGARPPRSGYPDRLWYRHFRYPADAFPVASALHDSWLALPATRLHGEAANLVAGYRRRFGPAWAALTCRAR
jgi:perosamine synthetase